MLARREGISINKSLAIHDYRLSSDRRLAKAQEIYAIILLFESKDQLNTDIGVEYSR
jgi:hypothetical protein